MMSCCLHRTSVKSQAGQSTPFRSSAEQAPFGSAVLSIELQDCGTAPDRTGVMESLLKVHDIVGFKWPEDMITANV